MVHSVSPIRIDPSVYPIIHSTVCSSVQWFVVFDVRNVFEKYDKDDSGALGVSELNQVLIGSKRMKESERKVERERGKKITQEAQRERGQRKFCDLSLRLS